MSSFRIYMVLLVLYGVTVSFKVKIVILTESAFFKFLSNTNSNYVFKTNGLLTNKNITLSRILLDINALAGVKAEIWRSC